MRNDDSGTAHARAARPGGARGQRRIEGAHPRSDRRLWFGQNVTPAATARLARPLAVAVHRRRAHRHDTRTLPAVDARGLTVPGAPLWRGGCRTRRPRCLRCGARLPRYGARARRRAGDVPDRRIPRTPDLRKLSRAALGAQGSGRDAGIEREPFRSLDAVRRPGAPAIARRAGAVRNHPRRTAHHRGDPGDHRLAARRSPRRRSPAAGRCCGDRARVVERPAALRPIDCGVGLRDGLARRRRSGQRPGGAARPRRRTRGGLPVLVRAPASPSARLRRPQSDPRRARRRGTADADGDRAAATPHARVDQGLPLVARRCRPDRLAPEALQLW